MADHHDKSLLDRLNALKPTTVSLDRPANPLNIATSGTEPAEPLSREDVLSERLKTLRNRRDGAPKSDQPGDPPPPYWESTGENASPFAQAQSTPAQSPPAKKAKVGSHPPSQADEQTQSDEDQDKTLDEILDSLVLEDDHWSVSEDGDDPSKRVEELLARLRTDAEAQPPSSPGKQSQDAKGEDDDDSEGEDMSRHVNDVLSRAMDEVKLEGSSSEPTQPDGPAEPSQSSASSNKADAGEIAPRRDSDDLALPDVPRTPTQAQPPLPDLPATPYDDAASSEFTLPTVPSILQDPVPPSKAGDPFESSIAARLAALKGPGHKPISTDDFGLPAAPTFQPEDRPVPGVAKKLGYTDSDMKTWCIVCLEDATVRCLGCEGDVYCARCWRDMHVGPSAGYDERGHQWEKFDGRRER